MPKTKMTLVTQKMYKALQKSIKHYKEDQKLLDSGKVKTVLVGMGYCACCQLVKSLTNINHRRIWHCRKYCAIGRSNHEGCLEIGYDEMRKSKLTQSNCINKFPELHRKVLKKLRSILRHCETRAMRTARKAK